MVEKEKSIEEAIAEAADNLQTSYEKLLEGVRERGIEITPEIEEATFETVQAVVDIAHGE